MGSYYELLGFVVLWYIVLWFVAKVAKGLWNLGLVNAFGPGFDWKAGLDSWAIVTGATDGIGLEYARQLAGKGYSLLLISRNPDKLAETKEAIASKATKCKEIRTLAIDFSNPDLGIYDQIKEAIESLGQVDVLINNVGLSYPSPEYFTKLADCPAFLDSLINVNIVSCTRLIHMVLPLMEQRKKGVIINLSSLSAAYPMPLLSVYGASKIYVDFLSRALQLEYKDKGIIIQSVLPSYVATKMSRIRNTSFLVPSAADYVNGMLKTTGLEERTYGYWTHKIQGFVHDQLIAKLLGPKYNSILAFSSLKGVRAKYLKKYGNKSE